MLFLLIFIKRVDKPIRTVKSEVKKAGTSAIAMSSITRSPALVRSDLTFSLHAAELPIETFLIAFHVPCQIKLQMDFGFPNHIPA